MVARRTPRPITLSIQELVQRVRPATVLTEVQAVWSEATQLIGVKNGELLVQCESSLWSQEISLLAPQIIRKINQRISAEQPIEKVRCKVI